MINILWILHFTGLLQDSCFLYFIYDILLQCRFYKYLELIIYYFLRNLKEIPKTLIIVDCACMTVNHMTVAHAHGPSRLSAPVGRGGVCALACALACAPSTAREDRSRGGRPCATVCVPRIPAIVCVAAALINAYTPSPAHRSSRGHGEPVILITINMYTPSPSQVIG